MRHGTEDPCAAARERAVAAMLIRKPSDIRPSEITDRKLYLRRREFIRAAGLATLGLAAGCGSPLDAGADDRRPAPAPPSERPPRLEGVRKGPFGTTETPTPYDDVTTYNNFYEFGTGKCRPARLAGSLKTRPWTVKVDGECDGAADVPPRGPRQAVRAGGAYLPAALRRGMVDGDPLGRLPAERPSSSGCGRPRRPGSSSSPRSTIPRQMPGQRSDVLDWPYVEGLRLDEAMHPLTILAVGLYGDVLPNQNGAPLRLVVPWKYGFKSIKSIVQIRFVEKQPMTTWTRVQPGRVRLLLEREPERRSPALEPGARAADRRVLQAQDADVQRLRRPGRQPVRGHGPAEVLLKRRAPALPTSAVVVKPRRLFAAATGAGCSLLGSLRRAGHRHRWARTRSRPSRTGPATGRCVSCS